MIDLMKFRSPISDRQLMRAIDDPNSFAMDEVATAVPLDGFNLMRDRLIAQGPGEHSAWDMKLALLLHTALKDQVPRGVLLDPGFWHWMAIASNQRFVIQRWQLQARLDATPLGEPPPRAVSERFLGSASLRGFSRNAIARLFWAADLIWSESDGYALLPELFKLQDLFQGIVERKLGLHPPAVRACLRMGKDRAEKDRRMLVARLNHHLTTSVVEVLDEDSILSLMLD